ncbi:MAG TPA: diaminopimelate epimerase [Mesotoga infera]|jgi:diaminopimelate epimerase|nr:diaminopimelate epimerase [Mesotoga sp.]NLI07101.1 diaminopimelate epimerase [Thermotogaceae bacterium]HNR79703.1 diaminopimelate epimerase [Mesotoga infera]HNS66175.1 diaminopimelate epimerase [Mesotoga infera]HOI33911.1 diaminopimelate epimerase [Mesotoga infera]
MKGANYSATGNTFLVVDSREERLDDVTKHSIVIKNVGNNDGVIFVEKGFMDFYNRDGLRASFCGNGARTYAFFIHEKEGRDRISFKSMAGEIEGVVSQGIVSIRMPDPILTGSFEEEGFSGEIITVGVPHIVIEGNTEKIDWELLVPLRHLYDANVNVYSVIERGKLRIRTYERGVEAETGACGSGATSVSWIYAKRTGLRRVELKANGGWLTVTFKDGKAYLGGGVEKCSEELELLW